MSHRLLLLALNGSLNAPHITADLLHIVPTAESVVSLAVFRWTSCSCSVAFRGGSSSLRAATCTRRRRAGVHSTASASTSSSALVCFWLIKALMWRTSTLHGVFIRQTQRSAWQRWPSEPTGAHLCAHCGDSYPHLRKKMAKWNIFSECQFFFPFPKRQNILWKNSTTVST